MPSIQIPSVFFWVEGGYGRLGGSCLHGFKAGFGDLHTFLGFPESQKLWIGIWDAPRLQKGLSCVFPEGPAQQILCILF